MELTLAQMQTLKTTILADPVMGPLAAQFSVGAISRLLNEPTAPDFWVYRTVMYKHDVTDKVSSDGTTFTWGGATGGYIARSQGERDGWRELWNSSLSCSPTQANVRAAFDDIFSGAGAGAANNRAHIKAHSRRLASVAEKLFAAGTGSTASPATMTAEGAVTDADVEQALRS